MLEDEEWSKLYNCQIAVKCNVGEALVRKMRPEICVDNSFKTSTSIQIIRQPTPIAPKLPERPLQRAVHRHIPFLCGQGAGPPASLAPCPFPRYGAKEAPRSSYATLNRRVSTSFTCCS